jgi:hypothetical protein
MRPGIAHVGSGYSVSRSSWASMTWGSDRSRSVRSVVAVFDLDRAEEGDGGVVPVPEPEPLPHLVEVAGEVVGDRGGGYLVDGEGGDRDPAPSGAGDPGGFFGDRYLVDRPEGVS